MIGQLGSATIGFVAAVVFVIGYMALWRAAGHVTEEPVRPNEDGPEAAPVCFRPLVSQSPWACPRERPDRYAFCRADAGRSGCPVSRSVLSPLRISGHPPVTWR